MSPLPAGIRWSGFLLALALVTGSGRAQIPAEQRGWLGVFEAAPEKITISWRDGLHLQMDQIALPVDGRWHETFATFGVRQRATWIAESNVIRLNEQHNYTALDPDDESGWAYEFRLDKEGSSLLKLVQQPDGSRLVVRRYQRSKGGTR